MPCEDCERLQAENDNLRETIAELEGGNAELYWALTKERQASSDLTYELEKRRAE